MEETTSAPRGSYNVGVGLLSLLRALWAPAPRPEPEPEPDEIEEASDADAVHQVPIEASIDLHFFAPRDIPSVVHEYLFEAQKSGFREVRLIHGRGKGIQRQRVQKVAARHPAVLDLHSDTLGSTLVTLRKSPAKSLRDRDFPQKTGGRDGK
jgi:dsDNA-specific endonuclease/ATPase MutS2